MSGLFIGPYPLDLGAVSASLRRALDKAKAIADKPGRSGEPGIVEEEPETGFLRLPPPQRGQEEDGIYFVFLPGPTPVLQAIWVVFGPAYLDQGVEGPPDTAPPYCEGILTALTEAVWWLTVHPTAAYQWSPAIILEWPPALAVRANLAPPGVPQTNANQGALHGPGDWLPLGPRRDANADNRAVNNDPFRNLPKDRSLLVVVRTTLEKRGNLARSRWTLVDPLSLAEAGQTVAEPAAQWIPKAATFLEDKDQPPIPDSARAKAHDRGPPLGLPRGGVGFPITGWLTRGLAIWPPSPHDLALGRVRERDVGARWKAQVRQVLVSTLGVVGMTLSVALLVYILSSPSAGDAEERKPPAPQPALALCSASDAQFINELRCQVDALSGTFDSKKASCADSGHVSDVVATKADLQAAWCGLRDRDRDGVTATVSTSRVKKTVAWADLAASRACFNVLGKPYLYALDRDPSITNPAKRVVDPSTLLEDADLQIAGLVQVVAELDATCDYVRPYLSRQTEGAILATHVGRPPPPPGRNARPGEPEIDLRSLVARSAADALSAPERACFKYGLSNGILSETRRFGSSQAPLQYGELCGSAAARLAGSNDPVGDAIFTNRYPQNIDPDAPNLYTVFEKRNAWKQLDGEVGPETLPLVERYYAARFGGALPKSGGEIEAALWACHASLAQGLAENRRPTSGEVDWLLRTAIPQAYELDGAGVMSQLVFDATLRTLDGDAARLGACWQVVRELSLRYSRVHPLLGEPEATWPSVEQQICGQVCAVAYNLRASAPETEWATPREDLGVCVDNNRPGDVDDTSLAWKRESSQINRLRIPWNPAGNGWREPSVSEVCAFHVVAQAYLPPEVVVGEVPAQLWAGTGKTNSQLAGGPEGTAMRAAEALSSVGRARSVNTCGHVAAQCFVSGMLGVMGNGEHRAYEWTQAWSKDVLRLVSPDSRGAATDPSVMTDSPWCSLIQPFISRDGRLPEGQVDYPCALGVEQTRGAVYESMRKIAAGNMAEVKP